MGATLLLPPRPLCLLLPLVALWTTANVAVRADEADVLQILSAPVAAAAAAAPSLLFVVARATFGAPLPQSSSLTHGTKRALSIAYGTLSDDCSTVTLSGAAASSPLASTALLLDRGGNCSFVDKAIAAQDARASLVIVRDTILGAYVSAAQRGTQAYDCGLGTGSVTSNASFPLISASAMMRSEDEVEQVEACTSAPTCATRTCVLTGAYDPLSLQSSHSSSRHYQVCCFVSQMVRMNEEDGRAGSSASRVRIPAVFLSFQDAETLTQHLVATPTGALFAHAFHVNESPWNASMLLSWLLGVCVVLGAAYRSCRTERSFSYENVALSLADALGKSDAAQEEQGNGYVRIGDGDEDDQEERQYAGDEGRYELSGMHALYFLLGASSVLLLLFYVNLVLVVNILFAVGASVAMADVLVLPLFTTVLPAASNKVRVASSYAVAALIALCWFLERTSTSLWPLQDLLGICLCFAFLDTIRIPSLRVATLLLSVACVYDVFFVYVSPFVFGSNVMVDVATGAVGSGGSASTHHEQRLAAEDTIAVHHDHYQGDVMPMVLRIPLMSLLPDYGVEKGGYALLGLGDLILPGLLLSFCIRYDYCMGYPLSRKYFCVASAAYALALLLANAMAIVLRDLVAGQPALMYIVPMMLAAVLGFAYNSNDLASMWYGPQCLLMVNSMMPVDSEGEKQPLVTRSVK
uniref:PA domain-containing protein n=1 Tax=Globisporangium ultimum (strain ATCC 200006 / CBS 805.95 / DAOM BR144) TaxID=431595 RepID=K3WDH0_GLOUD